MRPWGRALWILLLLGGAVALACARATPAPTPTPTPVPTPTSPPVPTPAGPFSEEAVRLAARLATMWGHLEASAENARAGDAEMARVHAAHPLVEVWALVAKDLEALGLAQDLRAALEAYKAHAGSPGWEAAFREARSALEEALRGVAGAAWEDPAFRAAVVLALLEKVEEEYGEAVREGRVTDLVEYQDARGFWRVAQELLPPVEEALREQDPEALHEVEEMAENLTAAFRENAPQTAPAEPAQIKEWVGEMRAEIARGLGLEMAPAGGPREVVRRIEEWMEEALREYEEGETESAYELAVKTYLEGFEHLEGDLLQKGHEDLVERLEGQFRDLREGIRAGKPLAELKALAEGIRAGLEETLRVLEE